jgi:cytochrome c-type biogenesis protein CcmH/NrfG
MMKTDPTEQMVQAFTQKMRETYVMLGKSLIPMMSNTPEDIQTLLELGEVYETLGCIREAIATYERARQLNPDCLPESTREFLEAHQDQKP